MKNTKISNGQLYLISIIAFISTSVICILRYNNIDAPGYNRDIIFGIIGVVFMWVPTLTVWHRQDKIKYGHYPINLAELANYGFIAAPAVIPMFASSDINISTSPYKYKVLTVAHNEVKKYYLYIREGEITQPRQNDEIILLRNDLTQMSEIMEIYKFLTGNSLPSTKN